MQKTIDWLYWKMLDSVESWQAAGLAAGVNPDNRLLDRYFHDRSFSKTAEGERFEKLWNLAKNMADMNHRLSLPEFALLLVSNDWPGIPEPLRMMAKGAAPALPVPDPAPAIKRREGDLLSPVIRVAQRECQNPFNANEVWPVLETMCLDGHSVLIDVKDGSILWRNAQDVEVPFTLKNLRDRLRNWKREAR